MSTPVVLEGKSNWIDYINYIQKAAEDKDVADILSGAEKVAVDEPIITDAKYQVDTYLPNTHETAQDATEGGTGRVDYPTLPVSLDTPEPPRRSNVGRTELRNLGI